MASWVGLWEGKGGRRTKQTQEKWPGLNVNTACCCQDPALRLTAEDHHLPGERPACCVSREEILCPHEQPQHRLWAGPRGLLGWGQDLAGSWQYFWRWSTKPDGALRVSVEKRGTFFPFCFLFQGTVLSRRQNLKEVSLMKTVKSECSCEPPSLSSSFYNHGNGGQDHTVEGRDGRSWVPTWASFTPPAASALYALQEFTANPPGL